VGDGDNDDTDICIDAAGTIAGCLDTDGDGVTDDIDADPSDPCVPDNSGPLCDIDGDGVPNGIDANPADPCVSPNETGWTALASNDCDGDGVTVGAGDQDDTDICIDAAGTIAGCTDTDGDGVTDDIDEDPTDPCVERDQAGWFEQNSNDCDNDGVSVGDGDQDDTDECVDETGTIGSCSDSDGDGVTDDIDVDAADPCVDANHAAWVAAPTNDCDGDGVTVLDGDLDDFDDCVDSEGSACYVIDGRVWHDADRGTDQDAGEVDLSGVRLILTDLGSGAVIDEAFTASPYQFVDVRPGSYRIDLDASTLPLGMGITFEEDGSTDESIRIVVVSSDVLSQDFGYATAQLCGVLYLGTFVQKGKEVTVTDAAGNEFVATTDDDGEYCVEGTLENPLMPGEATVVSTINGQLQNETVSIVAGARNVKDLEEVDPPVTLEQRHGKPVLPNNFFSRPPASTTTRTTTTSRPSASTSRPAPRALAFTGVDSGRLAAMASLMIVGGAALVAGSKRRRDAADDNQ